MSKESIGRDRWRQLGQTNYRGVWCPSCGLYAHVNGGKHRADCQCPEREIEPKGAP